MVSVHTPSSVRVTERTPPARRRMARRSGGGQPWLSSSGVSDPSAT